MENHVIIAGFGVGGRFIAEHLREERMDYVIVELNPRTCRVQEDLGAEVVEGDIREEHVLRAAGIGSASVLALAIPDEEAAVEATATANRLKPSIHIIAATRYTSTGLKALQKGADEVIVAEQAVAREFCRRIEKLMMAAPGGGPRV